MLFLFSTLLSILTLLPIALSAPTIDNPTTNLTTHQNTIRAYPSVDKKRKCYSGFIPWRLINTRNCIDALHKLPARSQTTGNFHTGGHYDAFKLPLSGRQGDCLVSVELVDVKKDEKSTWEVVNEAASSLIFGCAVDKRKYWEGPTTGGSYLVGDKEGIKVKVKKTAPPKLEALEW
ncbi:MAG: hypothetical protein Q9199_004322 [Rusavskia elegans]